MKRQQKIEVHKIMCQVSVKKKCPRVTKLPCVLDDKKMPEDNHKLRLGCPHDYQVFEDYMIFCARIRGGEKR